MNSIEVQKRRSRKRPRAKVHADASLLECHKNNQSLTRQMTTFRRSRTKGNSNHNRHNAKAATCILLLLGGRMHMSSGVGLPLIIYDESSHETRDNNVDVASDNNNEGDTNVRPSSSQHFPHASFIAHGHPSDPHSRHLLAMSYRYPRPPAATSTSSDAIPAGSNHRHHHHDWFHPRWHDVEPTRLHGGFTYTDAHVPTPLTHRHHYRKYALQQHQQQQESDGTDADGNTNQQKQQPPGHQFEHHYFSVPGLSRSELPNFEDFQHTVEEKMMLDEEIERRIDHSVEHAEKEVEDLSEIIQTIKQATVKAKEEERRHREQEEAAAAASKPTWWEILGIRQLLIDASMAGVSSNAIAMQRTVGESTCEDEIRKDIEQEEKSSVSSQDDKKEPQQPSGADDDAFKLSWRELLKAALTSPTSSTGVAGMASDASLAAAAMAAAAVEIEKDIPKDQIIEGPSLLSLPSPSGKGEGKDDRWKGSEPYIIQKQGQDGQSESGLSDDTKSFSENYDPELDPFAIESSRLLSASFALVSNSLGLIADTVRILGDTAAAASGASVKIVGSGVKTVSTGLENAGKRIELGRLGAREESSDEKDNTQPKKRKPLTSEKLLQGHKGGVIGLLHRDANEDQADFGKSTRRVIGKSVRLLASVGRGVGDSLLFAGKATESLASSTAGVAEDVVRVFEDFSGTLSMAFDSSDRKEKRRQVAQKEDELAVATAGHVIRNPQDHSQRPSIVSFGRFDSDDDDSNQPEEELDNIEETVKAESLVANAHSLAKTSLEEAKAFIDFALDDTEDVPSLVPDLVWVIVLCYVSCVVLLSLGSQKRSELLSTERAVPTAQVTDNDQDVKTKDEVQSPPISSHVIIDSDTVTFTEEGVDPIGETKPAIVKVEPEKGPPESEKPRRLQKVATLIQTLIVGPFKLAWWLMKCWFAFFFDRRMILLGIFLVSGLHLCRLSQLRSKTIARNAEATGFRSAVLSASPTNPSIRESAVWLNALLEEVWRVSIDETSVQKKDYPEFIVRAMSYALQRKNCKKIMRRNRARSRNNAMLCPDNKPYDGLEPYISSILGESVIDVLKTTSAFRPSDLTYLSLHSFTLGSVPPIVRAIKLLGINDEDSTVELDVDLDVLLGDSSIVLEIKLSTLDYALLPSTQVAIHSLDLRLPLEVTVEMMPEFPFVKGIKASLSKVPPCRVRVTPLSENSGLRGVDLGSLPLLSDWIQEALKASLEEYLSPAYIAFDLKSLWYPEESLRIADGGQVEKAHDISLQSEIQSALPSLPSVASEKAYASNYHGLTEQMQIDTAIGLDVSGMVTPSYGIGPEQKITADAGDGIIKSQYTSSYNSLTQRILSEERDSPSEFEEVLQKEEATAA